MTIRKATLSDINLLIKLRIDFLAMDKGLLTEEQQKAVTGQLQYYFSKSISNNTFIGIFAEQGKEVFSTAFLSICEMPGNAEFITGKVGTLLNVFTYPEHRRRGIATKVILSVVEEAKQAGVSSIDLSATKEGKLLYEKLGFKALQYTAMRLKSI